MTKTKIMMPGDQISSSEELLPGDGTFEEDGIIRAARMGEYIVDKKNRRAMIKPVTSIPITIHKGDIVLAEVGMVKSMMAIATVFHVEGKNRSISGDTNATLHASEISFSYVKDANTEFKTGDIFRAKVIQVKPSIQLTTKDKTLGSIYTLCAKCRHPLKKQGNMLKCDYCGNKEKRYTAQDYGSININTL